MARFELSRNVVKKEYDKLLQCADELSYSLKTNPDVGKILESETHCRFSVHSLKGLGLLQDKKRAIYFAQGWNEEEIEQVMKLGVDWFTVDNEQDLNTLIKYLEKTKAKINLLLRMKLKEHTVQTGKHYVYGFYSKQVNELVPMLAKQPHIKTLGLHTHRKTQNVSEWNIQQYLEESLDKEVFKHIQVVNMGGGLPSIYKNYRAENLPNILEKIRSLRTWLNEQDIKMIIEPGRFIAAPAVKLIVKVKAKYGNNIIVDASIFNSAMDTFLEHIRLLVEGEKENGEAYVIKGCTPDSRDIFRYRVYLNDVNVGDEITLLNAGAYNFATDFCFLSKIETVVVD